LAQPIGSSLGLGRIFDWWFIYEEGPQPLDSLCQFFLTESRSRMADIAELPASVCAQQQRSKMLISRSLIPAYSWSMSNVASVWRRMPVAQDLSDFGRGQRRGTVRNKWSFMSSRQLQRWLTDDGLADNIWLVMVLSGASG
jgi:hypothetical protein